MTKTAVVAFVIGRTCAIGYWCDVARWLRQNDMIPEEAFRQAEELAAVNAVLEFAHVRQHHPELANELLQTVSAAGTARK